MVARDVDGITARTLGSAFVAGYIEGSIECESCEDCPRNLHVQIHVLPVFQADSISSAQRRPYNAPPIAVLPDHHGETSPGMADLETVVRIVT